MFLFLIWLCHFHFLFFLLPDFIFLPLLFTLLLCCVITFSLFLSFLCLCVFFLLLCTCFLFYSSSSFFLFLLFLLTLHVTASMYFLHPFLSSSSSCLPSFPSSPPFSSSISPLQLLWLWGTRRSPYPEATARSPRSPTLCPYLRSVSWHCVLRWSAAARNRYRHTELWGATGSLTPLTTCHFLSVTLKTCFWVCSFVSWTERVDLHLLWQQQQHSSESGLRSVWYEDDCWRGGVFDRLHHLLLWLHLHNEAVLCPLDFIKWPTGSLFQQELLGQDLPLLCGALSPCWWTVPVRRWVFYFLYASMLVIVMTADIMFLNCPSLHLYVCLSHFHELDILRTF